MSFEKKIYEDFNKFKYYYEVLVERVLDKKYKLSVRSYSDVFQLVRLLNFLEYPYEGFLLANFLDYDVNFDGKYPNIRYLLNNRTCFNKFEIYHRKLGNSESVINYSKTMTLINSMRNSSYIWHQAEIEPKELKAKMVLPTTSFIFKCYLSMYEKDIIKNSGIDFTNKDFREKCNLLLKSVPSRVLDNIYKEEKKQCMNQQ